MGFFSKQAKKRAEKERDARLRQKGISYATVHAARRKAERESETSGSNAAMLTFLGQYGKFLNESQLNYLGQVYLGIAQMDYESRRSLLGRMKGVVTGPISAPATTYEGRFYTGEIQAIITSSHVTGMQYIAKKEQLILSFWNGSHYQYENIGKSEALSLLYTGSKGSWVWDELRIRGTVKGYKKPYRKIGGFADPHKEEEQAPTRFFPGMEELAPMMMRPTGATLAEGGWVEMSDGGFPEDPAPGMIRVYRGRYAGPVKVMPAWLQEDPERQEIARQVKDRWWTTDLENAKWYQENAGEHGKIFYQDLPADVVEAARRSEEVARWSYRPDEIFVPPEYGVPGTEYHPMDPNQ